MEPKEVVIKFQVSHDDKLKGEQFINARIKEAKIRLFDFLTENDMFLIQKKNNAFVNGRFDGTEYAVGIVVYDPKEAEKEKAEVSEVIREKNEPLNGGCVSCAN